MWSIAAPTATSGGSIPPSGPTRPHAPERHLGLHMELADILSEESVLVCTDISSKHDVLLRLAEQVGRQTGHPAAEIFEAVDDHPVDIVMMLLAPMGAGADHLKALARVARILRTDSIAEALRRTD